MRTIPAVLRAASLASVCPHAVVSFLTITHADIASPIRLVNNPVALERGGYSYSPFAFTVELPAEKDGEIGDAKLSVDAVDLSIIAAIRSIETAPSVEIAVALADSPDTTEVAFGSFLWRDITYNKFTVSGSLTYEDRLDIYVPSKCFTPTIVPGVF